MTPPTPTPRRFDPFRLLLENLQDRAVYTLELNGFILTWNVGARQLTGYTAEEAIGKHFTDFFWTGDIENSKHINVLLSRAVREGRVEEAGWRIRKDGSRYRASSVIMPLHDESGTLRCFGAITWEIAEAGEVGEDRISELSRVIGELEKTNRLKDDCLAMVSHELLTPLTSSIGWVKLIRAGGLPEQKVSHALEIIERNLLAQRDLIEDLLNVSRIVAGTLTINPQPINPAQIIEDTVESLRPSVDAKQQRIEVTVESDIVISADPVRFQQIFWNLFANAMKFTPAGGLIHVFLKHRGDQAILSVSDTGEGIARELLPYVFDRFRQASLSPSGRSGLGLGLSIVRHLVELHGGTVYVNSAGPGKGTTFSVQIPLLNFPGPVRNRRGASEWFSESLLRS